MLGRERHVAEHLVLAVVHQGGELRPARPELVGDLAPGLLRRRPIGLQEGLAQRGGDHGVLSLGHVGERVAHPMHPAALPAGAEHPGDRLLEPFVSVGDDQLHALQAAARQALEEARPEGLGLGRADLEADDLAPAVGIDRHGDYRGHRDDPPAFALLEIGGVKPEIGPRALERAVEEGQDPLVDVLAELRDLALGDPRQTHGLHEVVDAPGRDATDPGLLDHRDQSFLGHLAGLEERREVAALAELGDAQLERAQARVEAAVAVAVAVVQPVGRALVARRADHAFDVGLHQDLQHGLGHGAQKVALTGLLHELGQCHPLLGHRGRPRLGEA